MGPLESWDDFRWGSAVLDTVASGQVNRQLAVKYRRAACIWLSSRTWPGSTRGRIQSGDRSVRGVAVKEVK